MEDNATNGSKVVRDRSPFRRSEEMSESRNRDRDRGHRRGDRPSRFQDRSPSGDRDRMNRRAPANCRVYISNIPYEFRWQDLKDLFRQEVGEVEFVELFADEGEKPRGCGVIEFASPESVKKAIEKMHRFEVRGRKLVVKEDVDIDRDPAGRLMAGRGGGGGGGGGGGLHRDDPPRNSRWNDSPRSSSPSQKSWGFQYGLSSTFLENLGIKGPLVNRVFVANLDYKVDEKKLEEVFKLAGKLVTAELNKDKEGKSRGHGVVEYEHPVEAIQAISMLHHQMLYDRLLTVRMDRVNEKPDGAPPKLPEGLRGIGMGLGEGGKALTDVTRSLPAHLQNAQMNLSLSNMQNAAGIGLAGQAPLGGMGGMGNMPNSAGGLGGFGGGSGVGNMGVMGGGLGGGLAAAAGLGSSLGNVGGSGGNLGVGSLLGSGLGQSGNELGLGGLGSGGGLGGGNLSGGMGSSFSGSGSGLGMGGGVGNFNAGGMNQLSSSSHFMGSGGMGGGMGMGGSSIQGAGFGNRNFDMGSGGFNNMEDREYRGFNNGQGKMDSGMDRKPNDTDTVLIRNLSPAVTWQMLRDKFRDFGDVKFAEIRNKDTGLVRFGSPRDAQRACDMMDRTRLDGRIVDVLLY